MELTLGVDWLTPIAGQTLTASYVKCGGASAIGARVNSHSQLQFDCKYTPHANNTTSATYAEWELIYTTEAADLADVSGGSGSFTWKSYVTEIADPAASSTLDISAFRIKTWRAYADDTANKDRAPTFAVPIGATRVNLQVKEVGMGTDFGTFFAKVAHQRA